MKPLRKYLDTLRPHFSEKGKYFRWKPLYEAIDTFFYSPGERTSGFVQVRDAIDLKRVMLTAVIGLQPAVFMAFWNTGYQVLKAGLAQADPENGFFHEIGWRGKILQFAGVQPDPESFLACFLLGATYFLPVYFVTNLVGGLWEILFSIVRKKDINEGFLVTGFLFPLILPPDVPYWMVALGISFGVVIGKEVFGGTGMNFINVALLARAFLFFAYPAEMSGDKVWVPLDGYTQATALGIAANGDEIPFTWWDAFLGFIPGSMGETSTLAILIGGSYLIWTRISSWRIVLGMLIGFSLMIFFLNAVGKNPVSRLGLEWHLVIGGFAFGCIYMATDPVTASMTQAGRWIYGFFCGVLAALIRCVNPAFPEGVMLAILLGNVFAPTIDYFVIEANKRRRKQRLQDES